MNKVENINDVLSAVKELRIEIEKKSPDLEKIKKIQEELDKQEKQNQQFVKETKEAEKRETEIKERIDTLETELANRIQGTETKNYRESDEYKALDTFVKQGAFAITSEQKSILRTDNDVQGGFLVTSEIDNAITKKIIEISNIRSIARVRSIGSKSLNIPIRNTIPSAQYEGETEKGPEDTSTYGSETLTAFRQTVTIPITQDMLMDSAFDMESEIMSDSAESFAQSEGKGFVVGDGVKKPFGFTSDKRVTKNARISASSGKIWFDDMMNLTGDLKVGYNPVYVFNRRTLAFLRTLKGADNHPLWNPGMGGVVMNTINGFPYLIANDMPDIAAGKFPVAFGDFARGYTIVDRTGLAIIRDDITRKKEAIIEFTLQRWNTGQVTLPEAIKLLKVKA